MNNSPLKKVLIADDEADLREAVTAALQASGYEVVEAVDGEDALKVFNESTPDLVILDLNMPKMHGIEVLKHIRESEAGATVPVCILTAQDDIATVSDVTVMGGMHTDFLPKADHSLRQIIEHVNQHLG